MHAMHMQHEGVHDACHACMPCTIEHEYIHATIMLHAYKRDTDRGASCACISMAAAVFLPATSSGQVVAQVAG